MFKCNDCGNTFHDYEIKTIYEDRGEFWGAPAYEPIGLCPYCNSDDFEEYFEREDEENGNED